MRVLQSAVGLIIVAAISFAAVRELPGGGRRYDVGYPVELPTDLATVRLAFGLKDMMPTSWNGRVAVTGGTLLRVSGSNLGAEDSISGSSWTLQTRAAPAAPAKAKAKAKAKGKGKVADAQTTAAPAPAVINPVALEAIIRPAGDTSLEVTTEQGNFSFKLAELKPGTRSSFLDGRAAAEIIPTSHQLTSVPAEDDFPACASGRGGDVWCAFVSYHHGSPIDREAVNAGKFESLVTAGHGDQVMLMRYDGARWMAPMEVTPLGLDVWRPTVAVSGAGQVWVIWSQKESERWDLFARTYTPSSQQWSSTRRLTDSAGADLCPVTTTDSRGRVWLAWQSWRDGRFHIMVGRVDQPMRNARSVPDPGSGNSWNPAIAADSKGKVYVAWDHYGKGNYDVAMEVIDSNAPNRNPTLIAVAESPRFEARPALTVDRDDRAWIAFEDSDPNWAKDYGSRWEGRSGVPFYIKRNVLVRCYDGKLWQAPDVRGTPVATDLLVGQPAGTPYARLSYPRLASDRSGRVWLMYRRHALLTGAGERWQSFAKYLDGAQWSGEINLPESNNLLDNRPGMARAGDGLVAVYSSDGRTGGTNTAGQNDLTVAVLRAMGSVAAPALRPPAPDSSAGAEPVHPNETEDVRRIRSYRIQLGGKTYQMLRGEFHRHTEISSHRDQDGPYEEIWRYGLDVARMDWIGPGDHDNGVGPQGMTLEYTWWLSQKQIDMYHHAPVFMPMYTYERSVVYPSGHRNVIFARRGIRPLPRMANAQQPEILFGTPEGGSPDVKNFYSYLKLFDGICSMHTSATGMGTDWRDNDPAVEPVVEIYQGHRQNYEEPKAPMTAKDAQDSIGGFQPAGYVWNAFGKGYRLGFQLSSDHVSTHISYGVVLAEGTSREAIVDAFKKRHSYGTHDNIIVDVRCGNHMMGDEFESNAPPRLDIKVIGTAPIARIDIVRQIDKDMPTYVHAHEPNTSEVTLSWTDVAAKRGAVNMYYVRLQQVDKKMAWASPMWVRYR